MRGQPAEGRRRRLNHEGDSAIKNYDLTKRSGKPRSTAK
jgi:hypothetical protein